MLDGWVVIIIYMIQYIAVNFRKKKSEEIKGRSCSTTPGTWYRQKIRLSIYYHLLSEIIASISGNNSRKRGGLS